MHSTPTVTTVLKKLGLFALVGILALVVGPPLFSLALALLPFILIGAGVLGAVYVARHGWTASWHRTAAVAGTVGGPILDRMRPLGATITTWVRSLRGPAAHMLVGGALGGTLGMLGSMEFQDAPERVPVGIALGTVVGLLATLADRRDKATAT